MICELDLNLHNRDDGVYKEAVVDKINELIIAQNAIVVLPKDVQQLKDEIAALSNELVDAYNHQWDEKHLGCIQRMRQLSAV